MNGSLINPEILSHLPQGRFLLTAHHGDSRTGLLTPWVAPCSDAPVLLTVSVPRGSLIEPLIRDSRRFTLGLTNLDDRLVPRRFSSTIERDDDPFIGLQMHNLPNGGLVPSVCDHWIECELSGHLAPESGHRVYLGLVVATSLPLKATRKRSA
jgi:flavin reductase (DIM6/NTAB) family NADH-FMN oxidoreductase RutF